jgi:hypothetical protein
VKRIVIAAVLAAWLAPFSSANAGWVLVCTPAGGGAPTRQNMSGSGADGFAEACVKAGQRGLVGCFDGGGQLGTCPALGGQAGLTLDDIANNAAASACASYSWQERGQAPIGYIRGVAASYARAVCRARAGAGGATARIAGPLGDQSADALAWYRANGAPMSNPLRDVYTLALGEGMRESSGNPTEGADTTASNQTADSAEAGLFQSSYDSFRADPALAQLWKAYHDNPGACLLNVFMQGSVDKDQAPVGTGPAAEFQTFTKQCPSFALDYALVLFRVLRQHFGPINRVEAEFRPECTAMLTEIESSVTCQ